MRDGQNAVARGEFERDGFCQGRFRQFWTTAGNRTVFVRVAPTSDQIESNEPGTRIRTSPSYVASMSTQEFAWMIGILFKHDEARSELFRSVLTQSRIEQLRRDYRDGFWETTVSRLHNDSSFIVHMSYAGLVDEY